MTDDNQPQADLSLIVRRTVKGSQDAVFLAWTDARHIKKWWGPGAVYCTQCDVDLRPGGLYRIANKLPDGTTIWITGEFVRIEQPGLIEYSWQTGENPEYLGETQQRVTVRFVPRGESTEVIIEHLNSPSQEIRDSHQGGWEGCLVGLANYFDEMLG